MNKMINYLIIICIIIFNGCSTKQDLTDKEMLESAKKVYQNYLFEYGIDSKLFSLPIVEDRQDGTRSYKWLAIGTEGNPAGVEVLVTKTKGTKPEWILIGTKDAWLPLVNTKK